MIISYLGYSCYRFRGKKKTVLCDPYDKETAGFVMPKTKTDIVVLTHDHVSHTTCERIEGEYFTIKGPGEYEVGGVFIHGIQLEAENAKSAKPANNSIYIFSQDNFRVCHLGNSKKALSEKIIDEIDGIDVLFVPIGTDQAYDTKQAISLIEKIEPKIVIPMSFDTVKPDSNTTEKDALSVLIHDWGKEAQQESKLDLNKFPLTEDTQLVVLGDKN